MIMKLFYWCSESYISIPDNVLSDCQFNDIYNFGETFFDREMGVILCLLKRVADAET